MFLNIKPLKYCTYCTNHLHSQVYIYENVNVQKKHSDSCDQNLERRPAVWMPLL